MSVKVTKRQRKLATGPNAAVKRSLQQGKSQLGGDYRGANPVYHHQQLPGMTSQFVKVGTGIPFVRTTPKGH